MTTPTSAPSPLPGPADASMAAGALGAGAAVAEARPILPLAARRLGEENGDPLRILRDYAVALRAIVDHPALDNARKADRLAAAADALENGSSAGGEDAAVRAALTLRHLLEAREIDMRAPRQMLQAAGQDVTKNAYADWSDLLAWCRYWAAPMGRLGVRLGGGRAEAEMEGEAFATAVALLYLVERAPLHYQWLGRVYLPQRWLREAGAEAAGLGSDRSTVGLRRVFARTLDEARRLLGQSRGLYRAFPARRMRIAAATAHAESRAWAAALGRSDLLAGPRRPGPMARARIAVVGTVTGLRR